MTHTLDTTVASFDATTPAGVINEFLSTLNSQPHPVPPIDWPQQRFRLHERLVAYKNNATRDVWLASVADDKERQGYEACDLITAARPSLIATGGCMLLCSSYDSRSLPVSLSRPLPMRRTRRHPDIVFLARSCRRSPRLHLIPFRWSIQGGRLARPNQGCPQSPQYPVAPRKPCGRKDQNPQHVDHWPAINRGCGGPPRGGSLPTFGMPIFTTTTDRSDRACRASMNRITALVVLCQSITPCQSIHMLRLLLSIYPTTFTQFVRAPLRG